MPLTSFFPRRLSQQAGKEKTDKSVAEKPSSSPAIHEDIYTIPNFLTVTRIAASPVIGYLILQDAHTWAVGLLAYAGISDLVDGWIARRWNRRTVVGTIIDPMADKILMTVLTVCLAIKGALPSTWKLFFTLWLTIMKLTLISLGCNHYPGQGCWAGDLSHLLSLDFVATTENIQPILGLLAAISRNPTYNNQQIQYFPPTGPCRSHNSSTADKR